jgi:hypothetical protein
VIPLFTHIHVLSLSLSLSHTHTQTHTHTHTHTHTNTHTHTHTCSAPRSCPHLGQPTSFPTPHPSPSTPHSPRTPNPKTTVQRRLGLEYLPPHTNTTVAPLPGLTSPLRPFVHPSLRFSPPPPHPLHRHCSPPLVLWLTAKHETQILNLSLNSKPRRKSLGVSHTWLPPPFHESGISGPKVSQSIPATKVSLPKP